MKVLRKICERDGTARRICFHYTSGTNAKAVVHVLNVEFDGIGVFGSGGSKNSIRASIALVC